ncbi:unnamed protein product [Phyllotreta striolata]|uniref:Uncharacterized protein n=1 Tax=Phyllotreta striolata TaxID=444603 RepID=A0A9P0DYL4_PHYSR|nr:unnamed protein product [Phyllotreta striolata]
MFLNSLLAFNIHIIHKNELLLIKVAMSLISDAIDYGQPPSLMWKLPLKKTANLRNMEIIPGETVTIQLANGTQISDVVNLNCQLPTHIQVDQRQHLEHLTYLQPEDIVINKSNVNNAISVQKDVKTENKGNILNRRKKFRLPIDGTIYHSQQLGLKVPPKKTLGIKGKIIHRQAREVINNVFTFMKEEAQNGIKIPISNYRERVLRATGISKCTYSKITTREFQRGDPQPVKRLKKMFFRDIKLSESQDVSENNSMYRPKINRDASTPDGVYNLEDLVEAYILDTLAVEAGHIAEAGSADQFGLSSFSTASINKVLQSQSDEEEIIRRITIFLYINYLIKFMVTPMKSITKKFVVCDKSIDVNNHILNVFSEMGQSGRTRPLHMKDKALCYTMILAAIAMDFEVDIELLSKDLKVGIKKAIEVARILAFNSAKANNKHIVQLKVPLPAPVTYTPKRRKF